MQLTKDDILKALLEVYDPEIPISIVDMGLVYKVEVDAENNTNVDMTMTTRGCPMHAFIIQQAQQRLEKVDVLVK
jgi:metal-sulfur cluster biosynthetic enzyme